MRLLRPVILLPRNGTPIQDENVKDFRPQNVIDMKEYVPPTLDDEVVEGGDPKASSATEPVQDSELETSKSSTQESVEKQETSPNTQSDEQVKDASVVKARLLHPSSTKSGSNEPPAVE